jgi:hypothetical protein
MVRAGKPFYGAKRVGVQRARIGLCLPA